MRRWGSRGGFWLSKRKFRIWVCSERKGAMRWKGLEGRKKEEREEKRIKTNRKNEKRKEKK